MQELIDKLKSTGYTGDTTLIELIKACGDKIEVLTQDGKWKAGGVCCEGETPEEAVIKFLTHLRTNTKPALSTPTPAMPAVDPMDKYINETLQMIQGVDKAI